ncbi:zinc ribbon domain-containing protein [Microbacteriaceae bacterium K1510]|nr:zinc ribbon domain-containing protein [Microbacteriaceae bacterium K1510]
MGKVIHLDQAAIERAAQLPASVRAGLTDPTARISVLTVTRDGSRRLECYAVEGESERLAVVTSNGKSETVVSFPLDPKAVEALLNETLGLDQPLAEPGIERELDEAALWALAAMADAHRQLELESLLARRPERRIAVDEDSIYLRVLDGASLPDPRWLSGMLTQLLGPGDVSEARLQRGLAALERAGLIGKDSTDRWTPQPGFTAAFAHLEVPLSGARVSINWRSKNGIDYVSLGLLRTLAAVWRTEPRGRAEAMTGVALRSMTADAVRSGIHNAIVQALRTEPQPVSKSNTADARRFCPQCGGAVAVTDRFCGQCGAHLT